MRYVEEARKLETILGRDDELALIAGLVASGRPGCLIFRGAGGIGKTRLLQAALEQLPPATRPTLPIYDFFYTENFKASQIERSIIEAVRRVIGDADFEAYEAARRRLLHARQSGAGFLKTLTELRKSFVDCYNQVAARSELRGRPILLLFDTVEQAVQLTDPAEEKLAPTPRNASDGGEHWLRETLPQLQNTLVILSGRPLSVQEQPVTLYEQLAASMGAQIYELGGLPPHVTAQFLHAIKEDFARSPIAAVRQRALAVEIDPSWAYVYNQVAEGQPFWLAMLFTSAMLAALPAELDTLYARHTAAPNTDGASPAADAGWLRRELMQTLLQRFDESIDDTILAIQWMATARKGLSRSLLQTLVAQERPQANAAQLFDYLASLFIVKRRRVTYLSDENAVAVGGEAATDADEEHLFLHDEMYAWLDSYEGRVVALRPAIAEAVIDWYGQELRRVRAATLKLIDQAQLLGKSSSRHRRLEQEAAALRARERQLVLDRMGYYYQLDPQRGRYEYNLHSYMAIVRREYGYGVTLRQEALRNIYRRAPAVSFEEEVECAARWVLRAVWTEDRERALAMAAALERHYGLKGEALIFGEKEVDPGDALDEEAPAGYGGAPEQALLYLATARVRQEFQERREPQPDYYYWIRQLLREAQRYMPRPEQEGPDGGLWHETLRSQIDNYRGLNYRGRYLLPDAITAYRSALSSALQRLNRLSPTEQAAMKGEIVFPQLYAPILNNLSFALSEQGQVKEARTYARRGLGENLRYSNSFFVALSYNTLARIEIRAGKALLAQQYARQATAIMTSLDSPRGLSLCLPVLAETYRKEAEDRDDDPARQRHSFDLAVRTFKEAIALLQREQIVSAERWRETLQGLGCTYRSYGQAMRRHNPDDPRAAEMFTRARETLAEGLERAEAGRQPSLIRLDLIEDMAVVLVNADQFDRRIEELLAMAEGLAPERYKLIERFGLQDLVYPVRGFWRELGQCEMQRMLCGFGTYDYGFYTYDMEAEKCDHPRPAQPERIREQADLWAAAEHMVKMFAYLLQYDRTSTTLDRAVSLTLRELRFNRTAAELQLMLQAAYTTAEKYDLHDSEAYSFAEQLMLQALEDQALPIHIPMVE